MAAKNPDVTDTTTVPGYVILKWTSVGTGDWTPPANCKKGELLVVGGGGGAGLSAVGGYVGGSGGGGGVRNPATIVLSPGTPLTVTVGNYGATSNKGGDSVFGTYTATGGGTGGAGNNGGVGGAGGSGGSGGGGGGGTGGSSGGLGNTPATVPVQGYDGGGGSSNGYSGAGGCALSLGGTASSAAYGLPGTGLVSSITGVSLTYGLGGAQAAPVPTANTGAGARIDTEVGSAGVVVLKYRRSSLQIIIF